MICFGSDFRGTAPAPGIMNTPTSDPTLRYHPALNLGPHDSQVHTRYVRVFGFLNWKDFQNYSNK